MRRSPKLFALIVLLLLVVSGLPVAAAQNGEDAATLREEVERLKAGQIAILRELQEMRRLFARGPAPARDPDGAPPDLVLDTQGSPARGSPTAKVTLIEFADYQCPFCARFARDALPLIAAEYIETGRVRFVVRDYPIQSLHPNAFKAAEAVHCAGEHGKYWEMHDQLFRNQTALAPPALRSYAGRLGLDARAFAQCLESSRHAATVRAGMADGQRAGVTGTPAFVVGLTEPGTGEVRPLYVIRGARPYTEFRRVLDAALAGQEAP